MALASTTSLVDALCQYRLLEPLHLEELKHLQGRFPDSKALAGELIRRGWLTPYQANQLLQGKGQELLLGSYLLLERLGEGGMGEVFKARNWKLGRIVALKLIRKERLDNPDAVRRFEREVRSAAALSHPNIVLAYDADRIGGTHLLVMEYVEGTDLAKLVKKNGPLPVPQACAYIRQAALGLQHAYERGMVHRDIKPANLLLTADGKTVKILDMGLARLDHPAADGEKSSTMTQEGSVMGTPDYIAPEQAMDSHTVDIRADLYSLGCAFYYLLTGRVPFPGSTLMEKLLKHRLDEPPPVEKLRPEVSPEFARVVRKLMAKKPEDRHQTPAEVAAALASVLSDGSRLAVGGDRTIAEGRPAVAMAQQISEDTLESPFAHLSASDTAEELGSPQRLRSTQQRRRWLLFTVAGVGGLLLGIVALTFWLWREHTDKKPSRNQGDDPVVVRPPAKKGPTLVDDAWLKQVAAMPAEKQVEAVAAKLKEMNPGFDGKVTHKVEEGVVTYLEFLSDNVTDISPVRAFKGLKVLSCGDSEGKGKLSDLSPLKGMSLTHLYCYNTQVANLSPLKDMKLTSLTCYGTKVSDLSPLRGLPLTDLHCGVTQVSDLSPLKDMPLTSLQCQFTPVTDLSPLKDMKLILLDCSATKVSDLSPLKGMKLTVLRYRFTAVFDLSPLRDLPLKEISCDSKPYRDTAVLHSIKTLETINGKPEKEFWKDVEEKQVAFEAWCKEAAAMPAEKQVEAVAAKLKELNPGFDGKVTHEIEEGVVTSLDFLTDNVTDISPVRALQGLRRLVVRGSGDWQHRNGKLADLSPLKDMKLMSLDCTETKVSDLSPLKDMKLTGLSCVLTPVSDLSPLKDMKLTYLDCGATKVSDLSPLKDMKLRLLFCHYTPVSDLSPLKDMKLTDLGCQYTQVSDLSPLKGMNLTYLNCESTQVKDLSPLKDMKLTILHCGGTQVSDLSLLKDMPLKELQCDFKPERDAKILRSIKTLEKINGKESKEFWKEVEAKEKEGMP